MNDKTRTRWKSVWEIWIFLCTILIIFTLFFAPYQIVKDSEKISGIYIEYQGKPISSFNKTAMKDLISKVWCRRSFGRKITSEGLVEINFIYDNQPIRITLGENNYCYHSSDDFQINVITNAESVLAQFEMLLQGD